MTEEEGEDHREAEVGVGKGTGDEGEPSTAEPLVLDAGVGEVKGQGKGGATRTGGAGEDEEEEEMAEEGRRGRKDNDCTKKEKGKERASSVERGPVEGSSVLKGPKDKDITANTFASEADIESGYDFLTSLPDEIILTILKYLDIDDLRSLIKTSHRLRTISLDPLLHRNRLRAARSFLQCTLPKRPSLNSLRNGPQRIYLSRRDMATRDLSRSLTRIKLNKKLRNRPDPGYLIERGVLPAAYMRKRKVSFEEEGHIPMELGKGGWGRPASESFPAARQIDQGNRSIPLPMRNAKQPRNNLTFYYTYTPTGISPNLLSTCLTLEKQLVKDRLRDWVEHKRPSLEEAKATFIPKSPCLSPSLSPCRSPSHSPSHSQLPSPPPSSKRPSVRYLVRRFASRYQDEDGFQERESRWGRAAAERKGKRRRRMEGREGSADGRGDGGSGGMLGWWETTEHPARARVAGLKRFYERLSRGG